MIMVPSARKIAIRLVIIMLLCVWYLVAIGQDLRQQRFLEAFSFAARCLAFNTTRATTGWTPATKLCVVPLVNVLLEDGMPVEEIEIIVNHLGQKARNEARK